MARAIALAAALAAFWLDVGAAVRVVHEGNDITIENDRLRVVLAADYGSFRSVFNRATGVDLIRQDTSGYRALWGMQVAASGTTMAQWIDNRSSRPVISVSNAARESSLTLTWSGLGAADRPHARVTVRVTVREGDPLAMWGFRAEGLGGLAVTDLTFPLIGGVGALGDGADDALLLPEQDGRLVTDPVGRRYGYARLYPSSFMAMQFIAFYDNRAGFYLAAHDTAGHTKTLNWYSPPESPLTSTIQAIAKLPQGPVNELVLPYELALGTFEGDWTIAADLYKSWALQQPWAIEARAKTLPAWFAATPYGRTLCLHECGHPSHELSYATFMEEMARNASVFGGPSIARIWGWEKMGSWYYGDYFPPYGGWAAFDAAIGGAHARGDRFSVLISGNYLDQATPAWQSGAGEAGVMHGRDGLPLGETIQLGDRTHRWLWMSPATTYWRNHMTTTIETLAAHRVDNVQIDNWPFAEFVGDYTSGRPQGVGGNWQWQAWQSLLPELRRRGRAIYPELTLSSEQVAELAVPWLDYYQNREVGAETMGYAQGGTVVPLFGYVYKPLIQAQTDLYAALDAGQPQSYHWLALARGLTWGQTVQWGGSFPWLADASLSRPLLDTYIEIGRVRQAWARFLVDGSMLPPPRVEGPTTPVVLTTGDGGSVLNTSGTASSVQTGAWRAPSGETGIVLMNIAPTAVSFTLPIDFDRLRLPAGVDHTVSIDSGGRSTLLGHTSTGERYSLSLQPRQIAVVVIGSAAAPTECLLNWAERTYPELFKPVGATTRASAPYLYRHYLQTESYVGTGNGHLFYLGPASANQLLDVGEVEPWMSRANCR